MQRITLIGDLHFGLRNNNREWFDSQIEYFNNFLLPKTTKDDILFILGDIFDNRSSLNLFITHQIATNLFYLLSESFKEIHILIGNHDMYFKDNNTVTSIDLLKYNNITIYKDPTLVTIANQKFLFIPYYEDKTLEKEVLQRYRNSEVICLMHADISGFFYNKSIIADLNIANDSSCYAGYKHIYTGHFHIRQSNKNITYIGSPYHMDRNDIGNEKGLYILEVGKGKFSENFVLNDYSPKFIRIGEEDLNRDDIDTIMNNNYVDIIVEDKNLKDSDIHKKIKTFTKARDIKIQIIEEEKEMNIVYGESNKFDLMKLFKDYIKQKYKIQDNNINQYLEYVDDLYIKLKR